MALIYNLMKGAWTGSTRLMRLVGVCQVTNHFIVGIGLLKDLVHSHHIYLYKDPLTLSQI